MRPGGALVAPPHGEASGQDQARRSGADPARLAVAATLLLRRVVPARMSLRSPATALVTILAVDAAAWMWRAGRARVDRGGRVGVPRVDGGLRGLVLPCQDEC